MLIVTPTRRGYMPLSRSRRPELLPIVHGVCGISNLENLGAYVRHEPPWRCWRVLIEHRRIQHMSAPRKYDQQFRERAVRMYRERLAEPGESKRGARRHVG